jgi:adenylate cyclase class 2
MDGQETEAKFLVRSLAILERRLKQVDARLVHKRALEVNMRFDYPDGRLKKEGRVLRLREFDQSLLTYKGSSTETNGVLSRMELELAVGDVETAQAILKELGFRQVAVYEKYRRIYELQKCEIMLDELPIGDFVEIEGPDPASIMNLAQRLGLDPDKIIKESYLGIFEHYCATRALAPDQLTFNALKGVIPSPKDLRLSPADG